jgi:hypothetical protein
MQLHRQGQFWFPALKFLSVRTSTSLRHRMVHACVIHRVSWAHAGCSNTPLPRWLERTKDAHGGHFE